MSHAAQTWARKLKVGNGIAKAVLRHLADVADPNGESVYGFETLVREVEFTHRAVNKAVTYLIDRHLLDKTAREHNGKCLSPLWRVLIPGLAPANSHPLGDLAPANSQGVNGLAPANSHGVNSQGNPIREVSKKRESSTLSSAHARGEGFFEDGATKPGPKPAPRSAEPPGFAAFYRAYPRKVARPAAVKAFAAALKKDTAEQIMAGLRRFRFKPDPQYHPHPATWLNQERWRDEAPPPASPWGNVNCMNYGDAPMVTP